MLRVKQIIMCNMKTYDNIKMEWGREGLRVERTDGWTIAVVDITQLSLLKIDYGSDLDATPAGRFISPREKVIKWLRKQVKTGEYSTAETTKKE